MRKMIRNEGLLCGGSCGAAMSCALIAAKALPKGKKCVVVLPDSVRNYMTKALSDDWMLDHGFADNSIIQEKQFQTWWSDRKVRGVFRSGKRRRRNVNPTNVLAPAQVSDLDIKTPLTITDDITVRGAIELLKSEGFDMVPVVDSHREIAGVVTEGNMTAKLLSGRCSPDSKVTECLYKSFKKVRSEERTWKYDVRLSLSLSRR